MRTFIYKAVDEENEEFAVMVNIKETVITPKISNEMLERYLQRCNPNAKEKDFFQITNEGYCELKPKFEESMKRSAKYILIELTDEKACRLIEFMKSNQLTPAEEFEKKFGSMMKTIEEAVKNGNE